ncbi:MAG: glycosyltransferase family 39 protein [Phycisphaerae bacterium]
MHFLDIGFLPAIGALWLVLLLTAYRWCARVGVHERASRLALALIVPSSALVFSLHTVALASMLLDVAFVSPLSVGLVFALVVYVTTKVLGWQAAPAAGDPDANPGDYAAERTGFWWLPVGLVAAMYGVFLVDAVTRFPIGADALHYHLPVAIEWMQRRRLDLIVGLMHETLPENGMIVPFLMAFSGMEWLFNIAHVPNAVIVVLSIYGLSRAARVGHRASIAAACIAAAVPMVVFQSVSGYIDVYGASFWLASLLAITFATRPGQAGSRPCLLVLAGLAAGLALGSKSTYLVLVAMLGVVVVGAVWVRTRQARCRQAAVAGMIFAGACLPCSFFWLVRGAVQAGNPIYPVGVYLGERELLPGFVPADNPHYKNRSMGEKVSRWWNYPWKEAKHSGSGYPYGRGSGFGAAYAAFVPAGMMLTLFGGMGLLARRFRGRAVRWAADHPEPWTVVYLVLSLAGIVLHFSVFREMLRFVLPLVLVAIPLAGVLLDRIGRGVPRAALALICVSLAVSVSIAVLPPAHALAARVRGGIWDRTRFYGLPKAVDELEAGSRILSLASPYATYPLIGSRLQRLAIAPLRWRMLSGGEPLTAAILDEHGIDYIYATAAQVASWPADLPVLRMSDGQEPPGFVLGEPSLLFKVIPKASRLAAAGVYGAKRRD